MNRSETAQMLTSMAALDRRTLGEADVIAWQMLMTDVALPDALEAVRRHYAEHTEWMMPAHVRHLVRDVVRERRAIETATGWAPGQAGVPKGEAMPEISGPIDESAISPSVRALLEATRAMLPEGSREALMPRRVAWEREHRAHLRVKDAEPNPLYKPQGNCVPVPDPVTGKPIHAYGCSGHPNGLIALCTCNHNDMSGGHADDCPRAAY